MSNSAYVIPKGDMPPTSLLNAYFQDIVAAKFPMFVLDHIPPERAIGCEYNWVLHLEPSNGLFVLCFELDTYDNLQCIRFKHGHSSGMLWWIEYEIREEIAKLIDANIVDDCDGDFCPPHDERYKSFSEYVTSLYPPEIAKVDIEICQKFVPDQLKCLI